MSAKPIGQPVPRVDGALKVRGRATYAADVVLPGLAHAAIVVSTIARGRITGVDTAAAESLDGVLAVITHLNAPRLPYRRHRSSIDPDGERLHVLQDDAVRFNGQPIAVVVAETLEEAEHAASLVHVGYAPEAVALDFEAARARDTVTDTDTTRGDAEAALAAAPVAVDSVYRMARQQHNPLEAHATVARWDGERLTVWDKSQWVATVRDELAAVFGLDADQVRVISPFVGGSFGATLRAWPHVTLAALAARVADRPVKLVLTRRQMYTGTGYRPESWQRLAIGATRDGHLTAILHEATSETSQYENYSEGLTEITPFLHACPNVTARYRLARLDVNTPIYMRAPGVASGVFALECAMDELAYRLGIDPVELRLINEPERDGQTGLPFSSRSTRACYRAGSQRFGWERRDPAPRSMRDGRWLVGYGMATAVYHTYRSSAAARVRLVADGSAIVESAASDMGPGTYTAITQVASEALGLPLDRVRFVLGDSMLPYAPAHGGSQTLASVGSAVYAACLAARAKILALSAEGAHERYDEILARHGLPMIEATERVTPDADRRRYSMHAFGAVFAEVAVDSELGIVRVRRLVGAYAAGRIVNPRTARSQAIGGMVGGLGMALQEQVLVDRGSGRVVNGNLADYLVPVNADIGELDAIFLDEHDPHVNPLGVKGIGELAIVGVAPAIANAVCHATGRRVRELPITLDALL